MWGSFDAAIFVLFMAVIAGLKLFRIAQRGTAPSKNELSQIRANLEGVLGAAGPNKRVLHIVYDGESVPRGRPPERRYTVTLKDLDGVVVKRQVFVEAGVWGPGKLTLGPDVSRARRRG